MLKISGFYTAIYDFLNYRSSSCLLVCAIMLYPTAICSAQKTDSLVFAYPCNQTLEWAIKTFVENDVAAPQILRTKGDVAHQERIIAAKVLADEAKNIDDCNAAIRYYLHFFRTSNIGVSAHAQVDRFAKIDQTKLAKVTVDLAAFEAYVTSLKEPTFEGYWKVDDQLVGVKEIEGEYIGFNIEAHNSIWKPKQIKFRFKLGQDGVGAGTWKNVFYEVFPLTNVHLADPNHISVNNQTLWERQKITFPSNNRLQAYKELNNSRNSTLTKWNDTTYVLKIPRFSSTEYQRLAQILEDIQSISGLSHLIIDLRFSYAYDDSLFELLFPLIYTEPIFTHAVEMRSTRWNNAFYEAQFADADLSRLEKRRFKKRIKKLNSSLNEFVSFNSLNQRLVYEQKKASISPKMVSILTHSTNTTEVEYFIELASSSDKVQLFGTNTAGSLGLSKLNSLTSEDARHTLYFATTKIKDGEAFKELPYSIAPDVYFDAANFPHYLWIENVIKRRNESLE